MCNLYIQLVIFKLTVKLFLFLMNSCMHGNSHLHFTLECIHRLIGWLRLEGTSNPTQPQPLPWALPPTSSGCTQAGLGHLQGWAHHWTSVVPQTWFQEHKHKKNHLHCPQLKYQMAPGQPPADCTHMPMSHMAAEKIVFCLVTCLMVAVLKMLGWNGLISDQANKV